MAEAGRIRPVQSRSRGRRWRSRLFVSVLAFLILATSIVLWTTDNYLWRIPSPANHSNPRAIIVDQLALNYPDPSFVSNATQALAAGGYKVDYAAPSTDAVSVFRRLPTEGYDLLIIRAHAGGGQSIITTEPYSQSQYIADQLSGSLAAAEVGSGSLYFALTPKFVRDNMQGQFSGTTVIVMGCAALQGTQDLASAFLDRGATFFVGWDGAVTIVHTDTSIVDLVRQVSAGKSVPDATRIASSTDPVYGAQLEYLDWNTLVQSRTNSLVSQLTVWTTLGAILVFGPLAIFIAPKLFDMLERARGSMSRRKNPPI